VPPPTAITSAPRQSPIIQPSHREPAAEPHRGRSRVPIIVAGAATLAAIAVSLYASSQAHDHADRAASALRVDDYGREGSTAHDWNIVTAVGLGAAGVGAVMVGLFAL